MPTTWELETGLAPVMTTVLKWWASLVQFEVYFISTFIVFFLLLIYWRRLWHYIHNFFDYHADNEKEYKEEYSFWKKRYPSKIDRDYEKWNDKYDKNI